MDPGRPQRVHANGGSISSALAIRRVDVGGGRMGLPREEMQGHPWVKLSLYTGEFMLKEKAKGGLWWFAEWASMLVCK